MVGQADGRLRAKQRWLWPTARQHLGDVSLSPTEDKATPQNAIWLRIDDRDAQGQWRLYAWMTTESVRMNDAALRQQQKQQQQLQEKRRRRRRWNNRRRGMRSPSKIKLLIWISFKGFLCVGTFSSRRGNNEDKQRKTRHRQTQTDTQTEFGA